MVTADELRALAERLQERYAGPSLDGYSLADGLRAAADLLEIYFHKCAGEPREGARLFLVMLGEIMGAEIVTEWDDPVSEPEHWSVEYSLNL